jgi:hypothetical protein
MLTEQGLYERTWGHYPSLGKLLGAHKVPDHYYGWSSVSDNVFNWLDRLAEVAIIAKEYANLLRETTDPELTQRLVDDLHKLDRDLQAAARYFTDQTEIVRSLIYQVYESEERRRHEEQQRPNNDSGKSA